MHIILILIFSISIYSLNLNSPSNWQEQYRTPANVLKQYIAPDRKNNFSPNLNITKGKLKAYEVQKITPKWLIKYIEKTQIRMFPMFKVIEKSHKTINKITGALVITSYAFGKLDLAAYQFTFMYESELYTVVYTCLLEDLKNMKSMFEESLSTLRL